jgi:hypothetical protein
MKVVIGAISALALAVAGCGGSSNKSSSSGSQTISVTRAAYVSAASSGYKALLTMRESIPGAGELRMDGTATFALPTHKGTIDMRMTLPAAAAQQAGLGSTLPIKAVLVPGTFYMKLPSQLADKIPGGKPWWRIDLAQLGKVAGLPGFSSLFNSSSTNEPAQYLYMLRAASDGSVKNLGKETINGVPTTHYRAQVDMAKVPKVVPPKQRAGLEQLLAALRERGAGAPSTFPMDAWIDSHNLVRQIAMNYNQAISGQTLNVNMKMDFVDYGPQPAPQIPAADQTIDLVKLLQQNGIS